MNATYKQFMKVRWLLAGGLMAAAGWAFYGGWIAPLRKQEQTNRHKIADLSGQVDGARQAIEEIRAMEQPAAMARAELDRWRRERPAASAMVWFPKRLEEHFRRFGISDLTARLNTTKAEPELTGFQRTYWRITLPLQTDRGISGVMLAVAELEQQDPSVKVLDFTIQSDPTNPGRRVAGINVATLVRK